VEAGAQIGRSLLFRNLLKGTALYSLALFGQRLGSVILLPINTRFLNPADYGVLEMVEQSMMVASILLGIQLSASLGYFYFEKDSELTRDKAASTAMVGAVLVGIIASMVGLLCINPINRLVFGHADWRILLQISFLCLPLSFALEAGFSWVRITDRPGMFAAASFLRLGITIVTTIVLVAGFKLGVLGIVTSSNVAITGVACVLMVYFIRRVPIIFDWHLFIRMVRFSLPLALGSVAMFIIHFGDRFILPHYRSFAELGIYGIAYKIGMLISLVYGSFHTYWSAQVFPVAQRDDADVVIPRIFTYVLLMLSFCALGLTVFCRPIIRLLTTPQFHTAAFVAPLIIAAYYIRSISDFFRCFFVVEGHPEYEAICNWIGASVCLVSYFLLIPRYGMWGAASATAITFVVMAVIAIGWSYRLRPYRFEGKRIVKIVGVAATLAAFNVGFPVESQILEIFRGILLVLALPAILFVLRFQSPSELDQARSMLTGVLGRIGLGPREAPSTVK
jgi:O-antigen/teichoic acid export membrane protein